MGILQRRGAALVIVSLAVLLTACAGARPASSVSTLTPTPTPTTVAVPSVTGQDGATARDAIRAAGFDVEWDAGSETVLVAGNWTVDAQLPTAGTRHPEGASVTLRVSKHTPSPTPIVEAPKPSVEQPAAPEQEEPQRPAVEQPKQQASVTYANCTEARAAGVTPLHRGEPGYSTKLDRDKDGIACE